MKAWKHRNFPAEKWGSPRGNAGSPLHQNAVCASSVPQEHTTNGRPGSTNLHYARYALWQNL